MIVAVTVCDELRRRQSKCWKNTYWWNPKQNERSTPLKPSYVMIPDTSALPSLFLTRLSLPASACLAHIHSLPPAHTHTRTHWRHKKPAFWWINLYILEAMPISASILERLCLLLSWVPLQPSGVISLLAMLNSLIICVLHKKRTIPLWHTAACSAWLGLALMCIGCCVVSAL